MFARVLSGLAIALFAGPILADDPKVEDVDPRGKPREYKVGSGKYAIWYADDVWHFRATSNKAGQSFTGRIDAVDGEFTGMKMIATTAKGPTPKGGGLLTVKSKGFDVKYKLLKDSESGFDLQLDSNATAIKFTLKIDDKDATEMILIGAKSAHPGASEFLLPAKPKK
jgi:hypothetical protein